MPKVFFGLEMPAEVKRRLLKVKAPVKGARWQRDEQLHLTLVFVGRVEEDDVPLLCELANTVSGKPFDLEIRSLGCFGSPDHPRILWAGVSPDVPLASLYQQLAEILAEAGFTIENRNFRPHITVSRFGRNAGSVRDLIEAQNGMVFGTMAVQEFVLYKSTQEPEGSVYTVLGRFALA